MDDLIYLIEPMIPALRRYARSLVRDHALADDLVQDCLERVIAQWSTRRDINSTRSWVFAILHNLAMNALRQTRARASHISLDDADESALIARATQEDQLHYGELLRSIDALPNEQRSVLLLVSVEDISYAEVAKILEIPIGTVMSRLSRGRAKLLNLIEGDETVLPRPVLRSVK